ncbi:MAG: propionyl-coenzyme A carboxylase alpha polypeptide [Mesorhizobium sp.]|nr:MAG: propionyl-coenzyme A carboxylase alpha polypeptide [Mesorhizobium sp.]
MPEKMARVDCGESRGERGRRSVTPPSVLPDISPARGEIGSSNGGAFLATLEIGENRRDIRSPPLRAGLSGEREG